MLLKRSTLEALRTGDIDLVFRRWKRPTVKRGGRLRTAVGVLAIEDVRRIARAEITTRDARRAGERSRAALLAHLDVREEGDIYRVSLAYAGEDPRTRLRAAVPTAAQRRALRDQLDGMDARSRTGPWTRRYLSLIAQRPETRAPDLAASLGLETKAFKARVRRLKELGLTESRKVGYRLSPRGRAVL